jgi:23S rRNA pseudouridine2605 synthase
MIEGRRTARAQVQVVPSGRHTDRATVRITIHEGRNRQVRKMFDAIGHPVDQLRRVAIGPIRDPGLKTGQWRDLSADEVAALNRASQTSTETKTPREPRTQKPERSGQDQGAPRRPRRYQ